MRQNGAGDMEGQTILTVKVDSAQAIQSIAEYTRKIEECRKAEAELQKTIRNHFPQK